MQVTMRCGLGGIVTVRQSAAGVASGALATRPVRRLDPTAERCGEPCRSVKVTGTILPTAKPLRSLLHGMAIGGLAPQSPDRQG